MSKFIKFRHIAVSFLFVSILSSSCNKLYDTKQGLNLTESDLYSDWYEYRAAAVGLYGLQAKLVEQLMVLGELRGDLMTITPNADPDLVEIYNFNYSKTNKYIDPTNFFKLIASCNSFIRNVKAKHPEVVNMNQSVNKYDRIYAEGLCMRAWAYFNAARIYGKVPYIPEQLVTLEQIEGYVNSPGIYIDTTHVNYKPDGYHNDTVAVFRDTLTKQFYDLPKIIEVFSNQLETEIKLENGIKAVGYQYDVVTARPEWEIITWHLYSYHALLGQMYLTLGDYKKAHDHFEAIIPQRLMPSDGTARYDLGTAFAGPLWSTIFSTLSNKEHIYTIWFGKSNFQQNGLQDLILNDFKLKPTHAAVTNWETQWYGQRINVPTGHPEQATMTVVGNPGDRYRGYGFSYACAKLNLNILDSSKVVSGTDYYNMLYLKSKGDFRSANSIMEGYDTIIYKYLGDKSAFSKDINYIIYRAAGIHLYQAEVYLEWKQDLSSGTGTLNQYTEQLLNQGNYFNLLSSRTERGVRGRVGLAGNPNYVNSYGNTTSFAMNDPDLFTPYNDGIQWATTVFYHNPITNKVIGYGQLAGTQLLQYRENALLTEKALELAFEGERFYDLMRFTKRRTDFNPSDNNLLAKLVSAKYPAGQREQIYNYLLNPDNWYIHYFDAN